MRVLKLVALFATLTAMVGAVAQADSPAKVNLEVILRPFAGGPDGAFGLVKFRQPKDASKIVNRGVWVRDLAPNHGY